MKLAAILLAATGVYAIGDAVLAPTPTPEHPGFVDAVLASRAVMAVIRLAVIFAGAFVIASVIGLVDQKRWLTRVGPVQVSEADAGDRHMKEAEQSREGLDKLRQKITRAAERPGEPKDPNERETDSRSKGAASGGPRIG